jgi:hypothetical protein
VIKPDETKSANYISMTDLIPFTDNPYASDIITDSNMGLLRTLFFPKASTKPSVNL